MIQPVSSYTTWQLTEGRRRREVLEQLRLLEGQGMRRSEAARLLKTAESTLRDWLKLYERDHDWNNLMPKVSTGRKSAVAQLAEKIGPEETARIIATVQAANLETGSNGGSWRYCTATMDGIPQAAVDAIHDPSRRSKHYIPRSLTRASKVTRVQRLAFQGRRALALNGGHVPRFMDVLPGDIFVPDDYTPTYGFWVPWFKCPEYPFGVKLLQGQMIGIVDYASLFRPGYALVAREHSSYRAADTIAIDKLKLSPVTIVVDEAHEGGLMLLKLVKTMIDSTRSRFILLAYPPIWDRMMSATDAARAEAQQLFGRTLKPVFADYRHGTLRADVTTYLQLAAGLTYGQIARRIYGAFGVRVSNSSIGGYYQRQFMTAELRRSASAQETEATGVEVIILFPATGRLHVQVRPLEN